MIPAPKWLGSLSLPFRYKPFRLLRWHLPCHQPLLNVCAQFPGGHLSLSWSTVENRLPFSIVKESPPFPAEIRTINVMSSLRQVWPITKIIFFLTFEVKIKKNKQTNKLLSNYFESVNEIILCDHLKLKATEQYFPVVLCIILYNVILTFESVDEILWCNHLNERLLSSTLLWYCLLRCTRWF